MRVCLHVTVMLLMVLNIEFTDGSCPAGTFKRVVSSWNSKAWSCIPCAAGGWSPDNNSLRTAACWPCPVNTYSHIGARYCTPCPGSTTTKVSRAWAVYMCQPSSAEMHTKNTSTTPKAPVESATPEAPAESDVLSGSRKANSRSTIHLLVALVCVVVVTVIRY